MAGKTVVNPGGAFGYSDLATLGYQSTAPMRTSAAVTGPAVVAIGTGGAIATAATDGTASLVVGIAVDSIASGKDGQVVVQGLAENVPCAGAVAAGDLLKRSVTTAGYVSATATPTAGEVVGVAINASSSNTVDVWVRPSALS